LRAHGEISFGRTSPRSPWSPRVFPRLSSHQQTSSLMVSLERSYMCYSYTLHGCKELTVNRIHSAVKLQRPSKAQRRLHCHLHIVFVDRVRINPSLVIQSSNRLSCARHHCSHQLVSSAQFIIIIIIIIIIILH
jgi:hypothetical protein